jgi:GST-like protein
MLEECGIPYEAHRVDIQTGDQFTPEFLSVNPNNKIPAILDPQGPAAARWCWPKAVPSSSIWRKSRASSCPRRRGALPDAAVADVPDGGIGPMFGQIGFFHRFGGKDYEDKRPLQRYVTEAQRLLKVLDQQLKGKSWIMGDTYTIADMAILPWVRCLIEFYDAGELVGLGKFPNVLRVLAAWEKRPAVQRGLQMPPR